MRIFILEKDGQTRAYTTLAALYEENTKQELGVSRFTLDRHDWIEDYKNDLCVIKRVDVKTRGDIIREREVFL